MFHVRSDVDSRVLDVVPGVCSTISVVDDGIVPGVCSTVSVAAAVTVPGVVSTVSVADAAVTVS